MSTESDSFSPSPKGRGRSRLCPLLIRHCDRFHDLETETNMDALPCSTNAVQDRRILIYKALCCTWLHRAIWDLHSLVCQADGYSSQPSCCIFSPLEDCQPSVAEPFRLPPTWADWTVWHLPGGPAGPPSRWTATSNVVVGQGGVYDVRREKGARDKATKRRSGSEWVEFNAPPDTIYVISEAKEVEEWSGPRDP